MQLTVAVLFGGKSVEHEISILTALQACAVLQQKNYAVLPLYLTKENHYFIGARIGDIAAYSDIPSLLAQSQQVVPAKLGNQAVLLRWPHKAFANTVVASMDCVLPLVHGTNVEDGTLQGLLQLLDVPYVGCDVAASAMGMDKFYQKCLFQANGLPVLGCMNLLAHGFAQDPDEVVQRVATKLGLPVVVKPVNLGSSIGISKAETPDALRAGLELAFGFADRVLVEPAVPHLREINCAVLGNDAEARASVCEEPLNADAILSYENKYLQGSGKTKGGKTPAPAKGMASLSRKIPADLPSDVTQNVQSMAIAAFHSIHACGVARIDFLMDGETGELWLNEINTIPGSLAYYLWEASGLPFGALLDELLRLAFDRHRQQEDLTFAFATNVLQNASQRIGSKGGKA